MARISPILSAMNRGECSPQVLGRTDVEHLRLAAQTMQNWQPRVLGPMTFRPGSAYVDATYQGSQAKMVQFVAQFDDTAIIELTGNTMRVLVDNEVITRAGVSTVVPAFGQVGWYASRQTGTAGLVVSPAGLAITNLNIGASVAVDCAVSVATQDIGVEHSVRIVVEDGPILFRVGSSQGADDLFITATLDTGTYSLAFTPLGSTFYLEFASTIGPENYSTIRTTQPQGIQQTLVTSIAIEPGGPMLLPTPWPQSACAPPSSIKYTPSADVTFVACPNVPQQVITRYGVTSWGIGPYKPVKGPMNATPGSSSVILSIANDVGNTTMTSNQPQFSPSDVGTLFRLFHWSQYLTQTISFDGTWTDAIRVTGVSTISLVIGGNLTDISVTDRQFVFTINGLVTGTTLTLQRSFSSGTADFEDYQNYTGNGGPSIIDDGLNNEIVYYRLGVHPGNMGTSTDIVCSFGYAGGGGEGVVHVTEYISPTEVLVEVLVPCTSSGEAYDWRQSEWSADQGYPTATAIHEGRLWWAGSERWWGSTSDDYTNFDFDAIGDAAYIDESVGQGPIASINWLLSLDALIGGGDTQVIMARSDAIQSPLTPTNFNLRFSTNQGACPVQAGKLDRTAIFINQSLRRVYKLEYDLYMYNMKATELSNLNPDIGGFTNPPGGYVALAVQRNPDTIVHLVRADGQMVCLLYDPDDDVKAFWRKTTNGTYEDVIVMPGVIEDTVYVVVNRPTGRFIEQFARLDECWGDTICKLVDSHAIYQGDATTTISSPWLRNQQVAVWADGVDIANAETGLIQLDGNGNGTLPITALNIVWGLPYTATFLSAKLAYGAQAGSAVNEWKRLDHIGFVLWNTHCQGITYGAYPVNPVRNAGGDFSPDFSSDFSGAQNIFWDTASPMDPMPQVEYGAIVPPNTVWQYYDRAKIEFSGDPDPDARLAIQAMSPRPATVLAVTFSMESNG